MIVGTPIEQVKAPDLFNARFGESGDDRVLIPVDISADRLGDFLAALRGWSNCAGCIVTVPHKSSVVGHLDRVTQRARRLGAVNVVRREPYGTLSGDNFDGAGHLAAAEAHGFNARGSRALVVGAGAAGSAITDTLCEAGIAELSLVDADVGRAEALEGSLRTHFPTVRIVGMPTTLSGFDLVTNATPVGMDFAPGMPLSRTLLETLEPSTLVSDVVTKPVATELLMLAAERGCRTQSGPEMAAAQVDWLGRFLGILP